MANKNFRVIARETRYYYVDIVAPTRDDAFDISRTMKEDQFTLMKDPQNEFKVVQAVLMDRKKRPDELKFLTKT